MNKIEEILDMQDNTKTEVMAMVIEIKKLPYKKAPGDFLLLQMQDNTGYIVMPIWNNIEKYDHIEVGTKLLVKGEKRSYNNEPQLNMNTISVLEEAESALENFVPSYQIPQELFTYFNSFLLKIQDIRYHKFLEEIMGIMATEEGQLFVVNNLKWKRFTEAPAAAKHHGNRLGGLFLHTVGVMKAVDNIIKDYVENPFHTKAKNLDTDMLRFLAIIHDFEKTNEYKWMVEIAYESKVCVGHEVLLLNTLGSANTKCGDMFTIYEMSKMNSIILTHHGQWSKYTPSHKDTVFLEGKLLHVCDMIDSQIIGEAEK